VGRRHHQPGADSDHDPHGDRQNVSNRNIKSTAAITISDTIARNKSISVIGAAHY
jgi:hypothetical protein